MLVKPQLIAEIKKIIKKAQSTAIKAIDFQRVLMYWHIGRKIFEEEQQGQARAELGTNGYRLTD